MGKLAAFYGDVEFIEVSFKGVKNENSVDANLLCGELGETRKRIRELKAEAKV